MITINDLLTNLTRDEIRNRRKKIIPLYIDCDTNKVYETKKTLISKDEIKCEVGKKYDKNVIHHNLHKFIKYTTFPAIFSPSFIDGYMQPIFDEVIRQVPQSSHEHYNKIYVSVESISQDTNVTNVGDFCVGVITVWIKKSKIRTQSSGKTKRRSEPLYSPSKILRM
jgi:hypothetical protein